MNDGNGGIQAWSVVVIASALAWATGCSGEPHSSSKGVASTPPAAKPPLDSAAAPAAASPGSVVGRVRFAGEPPAARTVRMQADPYCDQANAEGARSRSVVVGADGGLAGVFVYAKSGVTGSFAPPSEPSVLDQQRCQYTPKIVGVQTGQPLEIRNSDSTLHNVHALPEANRGFNMAMPRAGMKSTKKFAKAEVLVRIKCDVHPWMESFVGVLDHPFFAVTGADGSFEIDRLAPGDYEIEAVHPKLGRQSQRVHVTADKQESISFSFAPPA